MNLFHEEEGSRETYEQRRRSKSQKTPTWRILWLWCFKSCFWFFMRFPQLWWTKNISKICCAIEKATQALRHVEGHWGRYAFGLLIQFSAHASLGHRVPNTDAVARPRICHTQTLLECTLHEAGVAFFWFSTDFHQSAHACWTPSTHRRLWSSSHCHTVTLVSQ